eukprot:gene12025-14066_t
MGLAVYYVLAQYIPNVAFKVETYGLAKYDFPLYLFFIYFTIVNPIVEEWFRIFLLNCYGSTILDKFVITFFYALYHLIVLIVFFNLWISFLFLFLIFIGGCLFLLLARLFGPVTSILAHMAADAIIMLIMS